jgi:capsular polysaccharide biosynthesis protein/Mrp family chromosome partitioning ATPase
MEVSAMDLSKTLNALYRYWWLLVLAALVASLITYFQLSRQPVMYRATTDILVGPSLDSPSPDLNSLRIGGQLVQTYAEVVETRSFLESVNNKLEQKIDLNNLRSGISTRLGIETRVLTIIVFNSDPKQAAAVANAAAQTLIEMSPSQDNTTALLQTQSQQLEQIITQSQANIQQLEAELSALRVANTSSPEATTSNLEQQDFVVKQLSEERGRLSDALRTLTTIYQLLLEANANHMQILQPATTATLVNPQLEIRVVTAGLAGLIFAIILIFLAEYLDDRLRFPGDLSRAAGVPLLSSIDKHRGLKGSGLEQLVTLAQPASNAAQQYREVVAKLLFSIGESIPYAMLLSSVGSKTGADSAVTAGNLAVAFAQAGYKVVLVDAQVDDPVLTTMFKAEKKEGLADLLITQSAELPLLPIDQVPGIRFLPAGLSSEKNSHAQLNPTNVATLLERLQKEADIVLVGSSGLSRSAENLTLASQVNAVILVARYAEAHATVVQKIVANLHAMNVQLAGVIFDANPSPFVVKETRGIRSTAAPVRAQSTVSEQTSKS